MTSQKSFGHPKVVLLSAYANGDLAGASAVSIEEHVLTCPVCRAKVGESVSDRARDELAALRGGIELTKRTPRRCRAGFARGILGPVWVWVTLVLAGTAALVAASRYPIAANEASVTLQWTVVLSPIFPVAVVAAMYSLADSDPAEHATPRAGLELVLLRTAAALALTVPGMVAACWALANSPLVWLLPSIGLSTFVLVVGSWIGIERAALLISAMWLLAAILTASPVGSVSVSKALLLPAPGGAGALWAAVIAFGAGAVMWRRVQFDSPGRA